MASDPKTQAAAESGPAAIEPIARPKRKPGRPRIDPRIRPQEAVDGSLPPLNASPTAVEQALAAKPKLVKSNRPAEVEPDLEPVEANPTFIVSRRTARDRIAEWAMMRSQGMRNIDIAAKLGITQGTLTNIINKAGKEGWLKFDSPAERLEFELAPMVVDNIRGFIEAKDKQVTLEAAKGLGLFKTHQALKVEGDAGQSVIAIKIDMVEPDQARSGGTIVGTPRLPPAVQKAIEASLVEPSDT